MILPKIGRPLHQHNGSWANPHDQSTQGATHTRRKEMSATIDDFNEGHDQSVPASLDEWERDGTIDVPRETEASFEEIER